MYEVNDRIGECVADLFGRCAKLNRGDVLPHGVISRVVGVEPHAEGYQYVVRKLNRRLEVERGITLWVVRNEGYKLLTVNEHLDVSLRRQKRAVRQIRRGARSLAALPTAGLNAHQRRVLAFRLDQTKESLHSLRRQSREMVAMARPTVTLPRVKRAVVTV